MKAPEKLSVLKCIGRLIILILLSIPFLAILMIPLENMWLRMLKFFVAAFFWNLTLAFLLDTLCLKLKLYDPK